jgi:hypothetical protein
VKSIQTALSRDPDVSKAVADLSSQFSGQTIRMVLYFASSAYPPARMAAEMEKSFAPAVVLGCTTAGELVSGSMLKKSVVAMAIGPEVVTDLAVELLPDLKSGPSRLPDALESIGRHFATPVRDLDPTRHVGLVLIDGLSGAEERVMDALGNRTDVLFVGGAAGDDLAFRSTQVFADGKAHGGTAILAVLRVAGGFGLLKTQSFACTEKRLTATRVREQDRTVIEFNGRPAAQAYAETLGVSLEALPGEFMSHPLGLMAGSEPYVRSPQQIAGQGVKFFCAIREGTDLSVLSSTDIVDETRRALAEKKQELGSLSGIVNFNCILRTLELEKKGQTEAYGNLFSDVPTVGFSTYGEEYLGHTNQTATMLLFK